jgi:hypothetical protein
MKMHSPGHSSAASVTASSRSSGTRAMPAAPPGDLVALLHVGEAVVEQREYCRCDLLTQTVTGTEILVDPHPSSAIPRSKRADPG